jgi:hypothetical protein
MNAVDIPVARGSPGVRRGLGQLLSAGIGKPEVKAHSGAADRAAAATHRFFNNIRRAVGKSRPSCRRF